MAGSVAMPRVAQHEAVQHYRDCLIRDRNQGLFSNHLNISDAHGAT